MTFQDPSITVQVPDAPAPPAPPPATEDVRVETPDGRTISIGSDGVVITNSSTGTAQGANSVDIPPSVTTIVIAFCVMLALLLIGIPVVRLIARRIERVPPTPQLPSPHRAQLAALGESVDRLAFEVERATESQRWIAQQRNDAPGKRAGAND